MTVNELKITMAQLNPTAGDVLGNMKRIAAVWRAAQARGQHIVVTPAYSLTGLPLEMLEDMPDFKAAVGAAVTRLLDMTREGDCALIVGTDDSAIAMHRGRLVSERPADFNGVRASVGPCPGADLVFAPVAVPFTPADLGRTTTELQQAAKTGNHAAVVVVNAAGGQDGVVYAGGSFVANSEGVVVTRLPLWEENIADICLGDSMAPPAELPGRLESIYRAMTVSLGDYARKSGFTDVVLGLSGGMDSALVAAVAGDALGAEHVHCVRLPSKYTSDLSNTEAERMCQIWGFDMLTLPIGDVVSAADATLAKAGIGGLKDLTLQNMQARARGYLLMTLSNDRGWLLLSTGNKSEIAAGYATLYGDMCGGFNPIRDVFKTEVFALARWRNANRPAGLRGPAGEAIPTAIIERPPSAELRPDQKDSDSLPEYPVLDSIAAGILDRREMFDALARLEGSSAQLVERVYRLIRTAEYKRRQGCPGYMLGTPAFTPDGRLPVCNGFAYGMAVDIRDAVL